MSTKSNCPLLNSTVSFRTPPVAGRTTFRQKTLPGNAVAQLTFSTPHGSLVTMCRSKSDHLSVALEASRFLALDPKSTANFMEGVDSSQAVTDGRRSVG